MSAYSRSGRGYILLGEMDSEGDDVFETYTVPSGIVDADILIGGEFNGRVTVVGRYLSTAGADPLDVTIGDTTGVSARLAVAAPFPSALVVSWEAGALNTVQIALLPRVIQ